MTDAKQYELILLYLYGELLPEEKTEFEKELIENKLLKEEYEREKELHELYSQRTGTEVSDAVLFESRRRLRETLNADFSDSSRSGAINGGIIGFLFGNNPKLAGAIAMLVVGIVIGKAVNMSDIDTILTRSEQYLQGKQKISKIPLSEITLTRKLKGKDGTIRTAQVKADGVLRRTRKKRDTALELLRCINGQ